MNLQEVKLLSPEDRETYLNSLREKILEMMGSVSAQVMASGLNAGNVSVGATVSSQKSLHESYAHQESKSIGIDQNLSKNHSISHKGSD